MPERPAVQLLDQLIIGVDCPECRSPVYTTFARALETQELTCTNPDCYQEGQPKVRFGFSIGGQSMRQVEGAFQRLQEQIRQAGAWVEVRPYP